MEQLRLLLQQRSEETDTFYKERDAMRSEEGDETSNALSNALVGNRLKASRARAGVIYEY